ncbi:Thymosin beta-4 family protein [Brugia pahangi]
MEDIDAQRLKVKKERAPKLSVHIAKEVTKGQLLKHVEISEKSVLPTALDIYREQVDENLKGEIKTHDTSKLRHAEVVEKNVLPTSVVLLLELQYWILSLE